MRISKQYYEECSERFKKMDDDQLIDAFNNEVGNSGWTRSRASYLTALHKEFDNRGYDYSDIGDKLSFSVKNKIKIMEKKVLKKMT